MANFEEIFYHDVFIHEISMFFKEKNKEIHFLLENEDNKVECLFNNISEVFIDMEFRVYGAGYISHAFISSDDEFLLGFKNKWKSILNEETLNKIKCYVICSSLGPIKILSECDLIIVSPGSTQALPASG
jgi:hypothetical protein